MKMKTKLMTTNKHCDEMTDDEILKFGDTQNTTNIIIMWIIDDITIKNT